MALSRPTTSKTNRRLPHRVYLEEQITKKREKEFIHQQTWNGQTRYYKNFENANSKYEEWTSPRYYETHQTMLERAKKENERKEMLEKRRERLKRLLDEEELSYGIEMAVKTRDKWRLPKLDETPVELLKDVNIALKLQEEEKNRKEAELALYHQWRRNNPTLREYERCLRSKELKLSWLDQQIEKKMQKEREVEECKKLIQERDRKLKELKNEEENAKKELENKRERLRKDLEEQMKEMAEKETLTDRLKSEEQERLANKMKLEELQEAKKREEERIKNREIALYNIKHHKLKLKQKSLEIQENLKQEETLIKKLQEAQLADTIENQTKKQQWKQTIEEFQILLNQQRSLEKNRQKYLDFVFESEAQAMYEKQNEIWNREKAARDQLFNDVLETIAKQIDLKVEENRKKQLEILMEREECLKRLEKDNEELQKMKECEIEKQEELKRGLQEQVKERDEIKRRLKTLEQRNLDLQLEKARQEEERLKMEIMKLQKEKAKFT